MSEQDGAARRRATFVGLSAVAMWSTLALLTTVSGKTPPFLLNALCFGLAGVLSLGMLIARGRSLRVLAQPWKVWALGVGGLFGYHFLYFTALKSAPPVAANLLNYLWPLLIVLLSGLLPGEKLKAHHVAGAALGFAGAAAVVVGAGASLSGGAVPGYLAALGAAFTWAVYSVLSRRMTMVPTDAVAGFCLGTAALSLVCHLIFEQTVWPQGAGQWLAVVAMGLFPVGAAFFVWDHGVKRGDIQVLGAAAYATPLLSTLLLLLAGKGRATPAVAFACVAVTAGAVLAAKDMLFKREAA
ncbi:DMT family transporter [Caulobacter sp. 17J65-9]|uniref:aromatic amino acid exporter YddG n=1 Tax=Caulobacter sp. 17J65-9 TaxID=2709382 RepID=UPI0013C61DC9|nr:DMT family transporter [Caulobacter sp. 17J65-9]NEX92847.1 DMT family transporter [Caulobacter sp. 17J65-9]